MLAIQPSAVKKNRRDPTASHADGAGRGGERRWLRGAESLADYRIHLGLRMPNLGGRGFTALAAMPALRGVAVSCKNVDDTSLSDLPSFPALRALMPMDVLDEG